MNAPDPQGKSFRGDWNAVHPAPKKPFPVAFVVLGVFGLLVLLAVLGGIKAFHAVQSGSTAAIAVGDKFVDSMGRHRYVAARSEFTPQVQLRTPAGTLQDIETLLEKHHGAYVAHGQPQWDIQNWNGRTSVRLLYPVQFTRSGSTVSLTLLQTENGYHVYDAHCDF